jgi:hypothetical protein
MYEAYITKLINVRKHDNADRLKLAECFGNTVVVGLDAKENDVVIYFPTDGQLSSEYCEFNNLVRKKDADGNNIGGYLDPEKRNIRALNLRGAKSDGLAMSLESLSKFTDIAKLKVGDRITVLGGVSICEKYIPKTGNVRSNGAKNKIKNIKKEDSYPLFKEHVDTAQLDYNLADFKKGDTCYITLKMHGTSARTSYTIKEKHTWLAKLLSKYIKIWSFISGTRRMILNSFDKGYYGNDGFRKVYHDMFKEKLNKGETVFYEIVGYTGERGLIMAEANNKLLNDKEFIKTYGETTKFTYGCTDASELLDGEKRNNIYIYRMTMTNEDGFVVEYPWELVKQRCEEMGLEHVPEFDKFIFTNKESLLKRVNKFIDGTDPIGKTHIKEGIVVRIDNKKTFKAYKKKSYAFKCLEGIIKDAGIVDAEEQESIIAE